MKVCGTVIRGHGRGATLGFPTANIKVDNDQNIPEAGVYAGFAYIGGDSHLAAIHIGPRPTFAEHDPTVEAHVLDFSQDLYGQSMCLDILHKLRDVEKFDTIEALKTAIKQDCATTRQLLHS